MHIFFVDGTIRAEGAGNATGLALKNCAPFTKCNLEINDEHVDTAENLDIAMPMYNLVEYSDNYQDSSATLYQHHYKGFAIAGIKDALEMKLPSEDLFAYLDS